MKRLILAAMFGAAAVLSGCDNPGPNDEYEASEPLPEEAPVAPMTEEIPVPTATPSATDTPPVDYSTIPPEKRSSAETVRPESETLFY
ncbi:hypothetical protein [uncultured Brevundimonas sp.]|uniref:hypothetical protein n=1 Tax=uncultured Brevundimonas sp. TaxID=213418 RepID=UPI0030EF38E0|tara:strand:- start:233 stop:496 length:264 start_codon:yes stop_codon:yes gene_type:complete